MSATNVGCPSSSCSVSEPLRDCLQCLASPPLFFLQVSSFGAAMPILCHRGPHANLNSEYLLASFVRVSLHPLCTGVAFPLRSRSLTCIILIQLLSLWSDSHSHARGLISLRVFVGIPHCVGSLVQQNWNGRSTDVVRNESLRGGGCETKAKAKRRERVYALSCYDVVFRREGIRSSWTDPLHVV